LQVNLLKLAKSNLTIKLKMQDWRCKNSSMADTKCLYPECLKSKECKRFLLKDGTIISFEYICHERNNYKWWKPIEVKLEVVKDNVNG
jgi:hypothetical protein